MSNIICFLTVRPSKKFYDFCKLLKSDTYEIYICIDDNNYNIPDYDGYIPVIKLNNNIVEEKGYKSTVLWLNNKACSRDKALYYFNYEYNKEYSNIWFIEEDVFIPTLTTILQIDYKYKDADLLTSGHGVTARKRTDWHWRHINSQIKIEPPYACSMICAIRVSKPLMLTIDKYATTYNNLFMDEALFNTLAMKASLKIVTPSELSTIHCSKKWNKSDILKSNLYHPIKSIDDQYLFRE